MIKIHEQISFLRKQKRITQEELAKHLGVTNQTVSKWEAGICCPDIQLLPAIAAFFHVSVDALLGHQAPDSTENLMLALQHKIDALQQNEAADFVCGAANTLHAVYLSKGMTTVDPGWDTEDAIEHAGAGDWGFSCVNLPAITTTMRQGSVFFSNNQNIHLSNRAIRFIASVSQAFSDAKCLRIAFALYQLTVHDENAFVSLNEISKKADLPSDTAKSYLEGDLSVYLVEQNTPNGTRFRFDGRYMHFLPVLSLLDYQG